MNALSEISLLIGERAGDLEKGREIFTAESRAFVSGILTGVRRVRSDPWTQGRVRVDLPREIDTEPKSAGYLSSQFVFARCVLRFKKGVTFQQIAEARFGLEFDETLGTFIWQVMLVPAARFQRIDDLVWNQYHAVSSSSLLPLAAHLVRSNAIRFVQRPLNKELTVEMAFNDVKQVLEFLLSTDSALAEAVGLDPIDDEA
jgi:hypothetical protein